VVGNKHVTKVKKKLTNEEKSMLTTNLNGNEMFKLSPVSLFLLSAIDVIELYMNSIYSYSYTKRNLKHNYR
jgi:hypothetical protein